MTTTAAGIRTFTLDNIMASDTFGVKIDFSNLIAQHGSIEEGDCTYDDLNSFTLVSTSWSNGTLLTAVLTAPASASSGVLALRVGIKFATLGELLHFELNVNVL